jgi:hypothetical protein
MGIVTRTQKGWDIGKESEPGLATGRISTGWSLPNSLENCTGRRSSGGGTDGGAAACQSSPGSGSWKEAIISKIGLPSWRAVTYRVENARPSRVLVTSKRKGSSGRLGRMK